MNRRSLLPFAFALSLLVPMLAQGALAAQAPAPPAAAPCTQFYLGAQAPTGGPAGRTICHSFYVISYSTTLRDPLWTSYRLTREMSQGGDSIQRYEGSFRQDPALIAAEQGAHSDYTNADPPYDRGHLTPANDAIDMAHQSDTFVVTNIVPQVGLFNRGLWRFLEASVHQLALDEGEVFIVTGATYAANPPLMHRPGRTDRIAVPAATYKAIYVPSRDIAIGYFATNAHPTVCTVMSIAELARRTGVNPFPSLPAAATAEMPDFTLPEGEGTDLPDCRPATPQ